MPNGSFLGFLPGQFKPSKISSSNPRGLPFHYKLLRPSSGRHTYRKECQASLTRGHLLLKVNFTDSGPQGLGGPPARGRLTCSRMGAVLWGRGAAGRTDLNTHEGHLADCPRASAPCLGALSPHTLKCVWVQAV